MKWRAINRALHASTKYQDKDCDLRITLKKNWFSNYIMLEMLTTEGWKELHSVQVDNDVSGDETVNIINSLKNYAGYLFEGDLLPYTKERGEAPKQEKVVGLTQEKL